MKIRLTIATLALASITSHAATITWGNAYNFDHTDQSLWLNTFDASRNGGTSSSGSLASTTAVSYGNGSATVPTINGITFNEIAGATDFWGSGGINPNIDEVLSGHVTSTGTYTLNLTGLTIGSLYQVQLVGIHDSRVSIRDRQYEVDNGAGNYASTPILTRGGYGNNEFTPIANSFGTVVGTFTADATTQNIQLRSNQQDGDNGDDPDPGISGYILLEASPVPEPSSLILLSIAGLSFSLRRKRK